MKLYHGTSSKHLDDILANGLTPRGDGPSNWPAASSRDRVYLTDAYAMYFAQSSRKDGEEDLVIVEIDADHLDPSLLQADEDFAWYAWRKGALPDQFHPPASLTDHVDQAMHFSGILDELLEYGITYETSLDMMGNCSHLGAIPVSAFTKVIRYSAADGPWWLRFHDPVISPVNYLFHGSEYRATQLVVAGRLDKARAIPQPMPGWLDLDAVEGLCAPRRTEVSIPFATPFAKHARQPAP